MMLKARLGTTYLRKYYFLFNTPNTVFKPFNDAYISSLFIKSTFHIGLIFSNCDKYRPLALGENPNVINSIFYRFIKM